MSRKSTSSSSSSAAAAALDVVDGAAAAAPCCCCCSICYMEGAQWDSMTKKNPMGVRRFVICHRCDTCVCIGCFMEYMDYLQNGKLLPRCTDKKCNYIVLLSDVTRAPRLAIDKYVSCVAKHFFTNFPSDPSGGIKKGPDLRSGEPAQKRRRHELQQQQQNDVFKTQQQQQLRLNEEAASDDFSSSAHISESIEKELFINNLKDQRANFILNNLPPAIALTAKICMPSKISSISKAQQKQAERILEAATTSAAAESTHKRPCFNSLCVGKLRQQQQQPSSTAAAAANFECLLCDSVFCGQCEAKISCPQGASSSLSCPHVCKKEDLASIKELQSEKKCPKCQVSIFKFSGCNMMTCPVCKYHFLYDSGEEIAFGNKHNKEVTLHTNYSLLTLYERELADLGLVKLNKLFESYAPGQMRRAKFIRHIRKCIVTNEIPSFHDFAKLWCMSIVEERIFKNHIKLSTELGAEIAAGKATSEMFDKAIKIMIAEYSLFTQQHVK